MGDNYQEAEAWVWQWRAIAMATGVPIWAFSARLTPQEPAPLISDVLAGMEREFGQ